MASLSRAAAQEAIRSLKPWFGLGLRNEYDDRRLSVATGHSTSSSTLVGSGSPEPRLARALRSVASVLYKEKLEDPDDVQAAKVPQTPKRTETKASLKGFTWGRSSKRSPRRPENGRHAKDIVFDADTRSSPLSARQTKAPSLDVKIVTSSLREGRVGWRGQSGIELVDPAESADDQNTPPNLSSLKSNPKFLRPSQSSRLIPQGYSDSSSPPGATYALSANIESNSYPGHIPEFPKDSENERPKQSSHVAAEDRGYNSDVESNAELSPLPRPTAVTAQFKPPVGVEQSHIRFNAATSNDLDIAGANLPAKQRPDTPRFGPRASMGTLPSPSRRSRFPVRNRLNLKKSLDRLHARISGALSPSQKPEISRAPSHNYDADAEDSENSPLVPSMGSRETFDLNRLERHRKYVETMTGAPSTESDDNSVDGLHLDRVQANLPSPSARVSSCVYMGEAIPQPSNQAGPLRFAMEANDRKSGEDLEELSDSKVPTRQSTVKAAEIVCHEGLRSSHDIITSTEQPSVEATEDASHEDLGPSPARIASLGSDSSSTSFFRQGWEWMEGDNSHGPAPDDDYHTRGRSQQRESSVVRESATTHFSRKLPIRRNPSESDCIGFSQNAGLTPSEPSNLPLPPITLPPPLRSVTPAQSAKQEAASNITTEATKSVKPLNNAMVAYPEDAFKQNDPVFANYIIDEWRKTLVRRRQSNHSQISMDRARAAFREHVEGLDGTYEGISCTDASDATISDNGDDEFPDPFNWPRGA